MVRFLPSPDVVSRFAALLRKQSVSHQQKLRHLRQLGKCSDDRTGVLPIIDKSFWHDLVPPLLSVRKTNDNDRMSRISLDARRRPSLCNVPAQVIEDFVVLTPGELSCDVRHTAVLFSQTQSLQNRGCLRLLHGITLGRAKERVKFRIKDLHLRPDHHRGQPHRGFGFA